VLPVYVKPTPRPCRTLKVMYSIQGEPEGTMPDSRNARPSRMQPRMSVFLAPILPSSQPLRMWPGVCMKAI